MTIKRLESDEPDAGEITDEIAALLDELDTSLMKRGTLSADSIDWNRLGRDSRAVLEDCLHLQALRALIFSLCETKTENDLREAMHLTQACFAPHIWNLLHPQGVKGERRRKQWSVDILSVLQQTLKQVDLAEHGLPQEMLANADTVARAAASIEIDSGSYQSALRELRQRGQAPVNAITLPDRPADIPAELDARGRAELRRDIRAMAERISRHEPGAEIAFLLRRYGAWLEFRTLPAVDDQGRVPQQPMPSSIVDEFRAIAERPTDSALTRLEDRLFNSPDWFEGHRLAARMAQLLGYTTVAQAIHDRVAQRLADLPGLAGLRYANDAPYVDPTIVDWAKSAVVRSGTQEETGGDIEAEVQEPDLKDRIAALETDVAARRSRRARAVAKLALAKELSGEGLSSHARFLLQELTETLSEPLLASWDSELADEVRSALGRLN